MLSDHDIRRIMGWRGKQEMEMFLRVQRLALIAARTEREMCAKRLRDSAELIREANRTVENRCADLVASMLESEAVAIQGEL